MSHPKRNEDAIDSSSDDDGLYTNLSPMDSSYDDSDLDKDYRQPSDKNDDSTSDEADDLFEENSQLLPSNMDIPSESNTHTESIAVSSNIEELSTGSK